MSAIDPTRIASEIEELIAAVNRLDGAPSAGESQRLAQLILSLYGAGLSRILDIIRTEDGGPHATLARLGADPLVSNLLVLHDLHPEPARVRVERALNELQRYLPATSRLTVLTAEDGRAQVRVEHHIDGSGDQNSVRKAIERAVREAAPEIETVQIDGLHDGLLQILRPASLPLR